jgi:SAM-dependent methyltransferase
MTPPADSARPRALLGGAPARRRPPRRRSLRQWFARAGAALLGLRRTTVIDGVRYRERGSSQPLRRSLAAHGPGFKEFDVRFPPSRDPAQPRSREVMRIRATRQRVYADLIHSPRGPAAAACAPFVRPGDRVVELPSGTGDGAAVLAALVGPSGGIVALETDRESVRYARRRYPTAWTSFEIGDHTALAGELDGSFDAAVTRDLSTEALAELLRVLAPGGRLALCLPITTIAETPASLADDALAEALVRSGKRPAARDTAIARDGRTRLVVVTLDEASPTPADGAE